MQKALKFKHFFEQLNAFNLNGGAVLSTGGEYYFNENADKQSNLESSNLARSDYILEEDDIKSVVCDLENQRVVRADAERTRGGEALDKDIIEQILTRYCKNNSIKYKQGLNEIVAPFLYMMQEQNKLGLEDKLDIKFVYNSFSAFIFRYMTNFFAEEEFFSL